MDNEIKYIFLRNTNCDSNEIFLDFTYSYNESLEYFYTFQRPLNELLKTFFTKISSKITKIKYKKCPKKIKNKPLHESCDIGVVRSDDLRELSIDNLMISDLLSDNICVKINETIYRPFINPPWIKSCVLPRVFMVNCPIYPVVELENGNLDDFDAVWSVGKSKTSTEWRACCSDINFTPSHEHLNLFIKLELKHSLKIRSQIIIIISNAAIQPFPQDAFQTALLLDKTRLSGDKNVFRLSTFNILSHIYADSKQARTVLYRHCDSKYLSHDYRQCLIFRELLDNQSDIGFLQEVDQLFFYRSLYPILRRNNYEAIFQSKSRNNLEGQTIFWRRDKLELIKNISIASISSEIDETDKSGEFVEIRSILEKNSHLRDKWQGLGQCMTGCVLRTVGLNENRTLILSNNHLFFHPKYELFRLFQMKVVLARIEKEKQEFEDSVCIIGGDFNASYEDESFRFIFDNEFDVPSGDQVFKLKHDVKNLQSVFKDAVDFTNYTLDYVGVLDHIIIENTGLKTKKIYDIAKQPNIIEYQALPNKFYPSDHLPLYCDIEVL